MTEGEEEEEAVSDMSSGEEEEEEEEEEEDARLSGEREKRSVNCRRMSLVNSSLLSEAMGRGIVVEPFSF